MGKASQQKLNKALANANNNNNNNNNNAVVTKVKRTRKSVPRDSPPQRSSIYRGVTRHRWTGRYEAHLWDKNCWNDSQSKKGRQVYLGAYNDEDAAAHAYDLAALKYWGPETILNFSLETYPEEIKEMEGQSREEYIGSLRRKSSGFSRGVSKYRGVARHHHNGRWEARIGRVFGNKYLYLGTYATQEEAATAYDMAAIEYRGLNAVTNFDLSRYVKWLKPNKDAQATNANQQHPNPNPDFVHSTLEPSPPNNDRRGFGPSIVLDQRDGINDVKPPAGCPPRAGGIASTALGLLLQSSKFKEMLERASVADDSSTTTIQGYDKPPRRSFPDDIQTYFDCTEESSSYTERNDIIFGDFSLFSSPVFQSELDN